MLRKRGLKSPLLFDGVAFSNYAVRPFNGAGTDTYGGLVSLNKPVCTCVVGLHWLTIS